MNTESTTPRTDAVKFCYKDANNGMFSHEAKFAVPVEEMAKLETELNQCHADMKTVVDACSGLTKEQETGLQTELQAAQREIAELKRDKERLDWQETNKMEGRWMPISKFWYLLLPGKKPFEARQFQGNTLRQAIDNAMKEDK